MNPDRIVIVNDFAHVNGGASQVALSSALALSERGHNVTLFSAVGPIMPAIQKSNIDVILLDQQEIATNSNRLRAISQGIWNRKAGRRMAALLANCNSESTIVHVHVWVKSLSSSVIRAIAKSGIPFVVTLHDFFTACPNGGLFNYQTNKICRLQPMSASCIISNCDKRNMSHKAWRVIRQYVQSSLGNMPSAAKHFITISDLSERILTEHLPDSAIFHRVRNPISISRREAANPASNESFLFLGRLDPEKGPLLMARAAAAIGAPTTFVGDGPMKDEVKQLLPSANLTGWVTPNEVRNNIDQARALVFPSLWYETQGLTVLEAAARGIPSIVPDSSAAAEMVEDLITGLVFKGGNVADLQTKMLEMFDDNLVRKLGRAAYEKYWNDPATLNIHRDSLLELYSLLLSRQPFIRGHIVHTNSR